MKSSFQTILIGICVVAFVVAVLIFSGIIKIGSSNSSQTTGGTVTIWGTYPQDVMQSYLDQLTIQNPDLTLSYTQKSAFTFRSDLITALANVAAPDIVLADASTLLSIRERLYTIPYTTYTERLYRDSFVDGASIFLSKEGVMALPLTVDPLVVYYNKDILAGQSYVNPPTSWVGLVQSMPRFLKKDAKGVITQTPIGLGETDNINHFKDILSTLFLQTGSAVVSLDSFTGGYTQQLMITDENQEENAIVKALTFYINFSNPTHSLYAWSRTLPSTLDMFLAGKSAFYIGRASELFTIQSRNPNLNFDVTTMFQTDGAVRPITYGSFDGVSIIKTTPQFPLAYSVLGMLSSPEFTQYVSSYTSLPPAKRDLLLTQQQNPYVQVFFKAALATFSWPDTNPSATEDVFRTMIRAISSGRSSIQEAIYQGSQDLQSVL